MNLHLFYPFSAGTVFRRQFLTSKDGPRTERITKYYNGRRPMTYIQMKRKELTDTCMMILN